MNIDTNILQSSFGIHYLRPYQELIIRTILESYANGERKDMLGILPTGSGKSLCFMHPIRQLSIRAVIIYPLLSLMSDQKERFDRAGIPAVVLRGGLEKEERQKRIEFLKANPSASVITNPETLLAMIARGEDRFLRKSTELVVIDEAHTAVTWGSSFREAYRELPRIIDAISPKIVLAFTATADKAIGKGILDRVFSGRNVYIVHSSPDRENIFYHAVYPLSKEQEARRILTDPASRPAVIFLRSRILAERIASALSDTFHAACYHAGLPADERREKEEWFSASADGVLAATSAYGMGVDKKNIRTIIHWSCPDDTASFMQESGRAGRDGNPADSYIFLSYSDDASIARPFTSGCIRHGILSAMGETMEGERCLACSACTGCDSQRAGEKEIIGYIRRHPLTSYINAAAAIPAKGLYKKKVRLPRWSEKKVMKAMDILIHEGRIRRVLGRLIAKA